MNLDVNVPEGANGVSPADLDEIDLQLIELLQQDGRAAYADLGAQVNLSGDAIRDRLERLRRGGVVEVIGAVNPDALGFRAFALVGVSVSGPIDPAVERLLEVTEVDFLACTAGRFDLLFELVCRDDDHLIDTLEGGVRAIPGVERIVTFPYLEVFKWQSGERARSTTPMLRAAEGPDAEPAEELTDSDRDLLKALQQDGRATFRELSERTGVPYSSARRRTQALLSSGVVEIRTVVNRLATTRQSVAGMGIRVDGDLRSVTAAVRDMPEAEIVVATGGPFDLMVEVACSDRPHLVRLADEIRAIKGLATVELLPYLRLLKLPIPWAISLDG